MKQVQQFKYLASVLTENGKLDIEIRRRTGIAKDGKKQENIAELIGNINALECWTISSQLKINWRQQKCRSIERC